MIKRFGRPKGATLLLGILFTGLALPVFAAPAQDGDATARKLVAHQLQASQRTWLTFRDAELKTQSDMLATRQGTMYVPMEEEEQLSLTRDRARRFESYERVLEIDGQ